MSTTEPPHRPTPSAPSAPAAPSPPSKPTSRSARADRAVVRLRSPGDLLAALPYHLGYVPERSLVVLTLRGTSLFFVGRVDLPSASASGRDAAVALLEPLGRHGFDRALVVTVEDALLADPDPGVRPRRAAPRSWTDLAREVCDGLRARGVEVDERITVRDGLWWCPDGNARERRPQRLPADSDVPAVAEFVGRGRVPLRHRDDLAALVRSAPEAGGGAERVDDLVGRFAQDGAERRFLRRAAVVAWARFVAQEPERAPRHRATADHPRAGTDPDLGLLAASLHDTVLRDLVLFWLCPDEADADPSDPSGASGASDPSEAWHASDPDPEQVTLAESLRALGSQGDLGRERGHLVAVLTRLCRACPPGRGAPVLAVLGHVAWWHGDGTLARVAVDAALEQDPDHSLAVLLAQLLDLAVAPSHVA